VLTLYWLFMDADAFPEHLPADEFLILGTAQNLDLAEEAWDAALKRCDPFPEEDDEHFVVPDLQSETRKPVKKNGSKSLRLKNGAKYEPRAASRMGGRGKSAARVLMDEMREQQTWDVWGAVSKTKNAIFNSQLWGISSAGDAKSVVLSTLRDGLLKTISAYEMYVESGIQTLEEFANTHDIASALFEWSAPDGAALTDLDGILQSNPSVGYKPMFLDSIMSDLLGDEPESTKRTEILCQWVTALVDVYLDGEAWAKLLDPESQPATDSPLIMGIDCSGDRSKTYIAIAGFREPVWRVMEDEDGQERPRQVVPVHGELIAQRASNLWVVEFAEKVKKKQGIDTIAIQARGAPASELIEPLKKAGFNIVEIGGSALGASAGKTRDRVRDKTLFHRGQAPFDLAVAGGVTRRLGEVRVWDRDASITDVSPMIALSNALYALEAYEKPEHVPATPPPPAEIVTRDDVSYSDVNLAIAAF
jgi:hypothetical protein